MPEINGDEQRYPDRRASFSKTLPHDELGEVDAEAYRVGLQSWRTATPRNSSVHLATSTISDGRVSGVALDIAAADDRELPTYGRSVWPGIHRMAVLRMLGAPAEDRFRESLDMKLEHMIFARAGQADLTVVLIDDRVVTRKAGRALPPDIFALSLPLATGAPDQGIERPRSTRMHLGMSMRDESRYLSMRTTTPALSVVATSAAAPIVRSTSASGMPMYSCVAGVGTRWLSA